MTQINFKEYETRKIVNVHRHVDGPWFWDKYSAHPYVGCRNGCEFCYARGGQYLGRRDPDTFDSIIKVKLNAATRLRKELSRRPRDVIACGDWQQPAETRYRLSRQMLEVVHDLGFPLLVIERSPLVIRDLDLLEEINRRAWVGAMFSISNLDRALKQAYEPRSPGAGRRLKAMEALARAGILVGTALMPIFPILGDDRHHLEEVIRATKDHGGTFVVAGGLTMHGAQAARTIEATRRLDPKAAARLSRMYGLGEPNRTQSAPQRRYQARIGSTVRELCDRHGLRDRMPRYTGSGPLGTNKRIAERLFLKTYDLELEQAKEYRIWAYRKAAWIVDELSEDISRLYDDRGEDGLRELPTIGPGLAREIAQWLQEDSCRGETLPSRDDRDRIQQHDRGTTLELPLF